MAEYVLSLVVGTIIAHIPLGLSLLLSFILGESKWCPWLLLIMTVMVALMMGIGSFLWTYRMIGDSLESGKN